MPIPDTTENPFRGVQWLELVRDYEHRDQLYPNKVWWKMIVHFDSPAQPEPSRGA